MPELELLWCSKDATLQKNLLIDKLLVVIDRESCTIEDKMNYNDLLSTNHSLIHPVIIYRYICTKICDVLILLYFGCLRQLC